MAAPGLDPKIDYLFKRLFGSEDNVFLLIDLLNAFLPLRTPVRQVEVRNPFSHKAHPQDKVSVLDIKVRDENGRQFHLEMQLFVPFSFGHRALYYWAGLHASQMLAGDYYETLCPSYSLCFLNETLFKDEAYHHVFEIVDRQHGNLLDQGSQVHLVELNKFHVPVEEVQTAKERWCYFLRHGATLDPERLPVTLDMPLIRRALEVIMAVSQDEIERWRIHDRLVGIRDHVTMMEDARRAKEEARQAKAELQHKQEELQHKQEELQHKQEQAQKAQEQAQKAQDQAQKAQEQAQKAQDQAQKGPVIGRILLCQEALKQPATPQEELFPLSLEELQRRADDLKQQLLAPRQGAS